MHVLTATYTPVLWFLVGKRLDVRARTKGTSRSMRSKVLAVAALAVLFIVGSMMLWFLVEGQRHTVDALTLAWILGGIVAIWLRLRQPTVSNV